MRSARPPVRSSRTKPSTTSVRKSISSWDTHYNIALLFDEDRSRGRARAKEFRRELRRADIDQWTRGEQRYRMAMLLNRLSLSYNSIKRLVARRRH